VGDPSDADDLLVEDRIDDAMVADTDPVVVAARELDRTRRPWFLCECVDRRADPIPERWLQLAEGARSRLMEP